MKLERERHRQRCNQLNDFMNFRLESSGNVNMSQEAFRLIEKSSPAVVKFHDLSWLIFQFLFAWLPHKSRKLVYLFIGFYSTFLQHSTHAHLFSLSLSFALKTCNKTFFFGCNNGRSETINKIVDIKNCV